MTEQSPILNHLLKNILRFKSSSEVHHRNSKNAALKLLDPNNHKNGLKNITLKDFLVKQLNVKEHPTEPSQLNPDFVKKYLKNNSAV